MFRSLFGKKRRRSKPGGVSTDDSIRSARVGDVVVIEGFPPTYEDAFFIVESKNRLESAFGRSYELIAVEDETLAIRAVPNPAKVGLTTFAMIGINVCPDMLDKVAVALSDRDEVGFLAVSTSRYDFLSWTLVKDLDELRDFLETFLAKVPGIRKSETMVLLDVRKRNLGRVG